METNFLLKSSCPAAMQKRAGTAMTGKINKGGCPAYVSANIEDSPPDGARPVISVRVPG